MNRSLDARLGKLEAERGAGRTLCIWVQDTSRSAIDAEIARRKAADPLGEFDKVLVFSWKNPDARTA
jgi:hypothetical protein